MAERFWSDDFDADLLKVVPGVVEALGDDAAIPLWTYCRNPTHGRLNHPNCWNGLGALFFVAEPHHPRNEHGWVNIDGFVTNAQTIECTWLEVLRDVFVHAVDVVVEGERIVDGQLFGSLCMGLMYFVRGWRPNDPERVEQLRRRARRVIRDSTAALKEIRKGGAT